MQLFKNHVRQYNEESREKINAVYKMICEKLTFVNQMSGVKNNDRMTVNVILLSTVYRLHCPRSVSRCNPEEYKTWHI